MQATRGCTFPWILPYAGKIPWCPYWFKFILDASYHIYFYQDQPIIRHPCKTKAFVQPYLSYGIAIWGQAASTNLKKILILHKRALRLIHFKPFRFHAVPLFKFSNVLPLNFLYFKTICLILHGVFNNVTPPNVSNLFTYSSKNIVIIHDFLRLEISILSIENGPYEKLLFKNWCKNVE